MKYVIYLQSTGQITAAGTCAMMRDVAAQMHTADHRFIEAEGNEELHMVVDGELADRPKLFDDVYSVSVGDELVIEVPADTLIRFQGTDTIIDDGLFEYTPSMAGSAKLMLRPPFPAIQQTVEIIVHDEV